MKMSWKNLERLVKKVRGKEVGGIVNDIVFDETIMEFIGKGAEFIEAGMKTIWNAKKVKIHTVLHDSMIEFLNSLELINQELAGQAATKFADAAIDKVEALLMEVFD
jgi:tRNA G37 N-methylase Trm5